MSGQVLVWCVFTDAGLFYMVDLHDFMYLHDQNALKNKHLLNVSLLAFLVFN